MRLDERVLQDPRAAAFVSAEADEPASPVNGSPARDAAVAVLSALVLAALSVGAVRLVRRPVGSADQLTTAAGLPVLAQLRHRAADTDGGVEVAARPLSPASDAYRRLHAALDAASRPAPIRTLLVTGIGGANDGPASVAVNLAALLAQGGKRVALVDLDLRNPRLRGPLGLSDERDVGDVLAPGTDIRAAIEAVEVAGWELDVLVVGAGAQEPVARLRSPAAEALVSGSFGPYDVVVSVTAPLPLADSLVVARSVDAALLVVDVGTGAEDAAAAVADLTAAGIRLPGVVLTGVPTRFAR